MLDLTHVANIDYEVRHNAEHEINKPFDLEKDLLMRVKLLRTGIEEYVLFFTMHHIISDAWSLSVLAKELIHLYESFETNKPAQLPELTIQYKDYAEWQNKQVKNGWLNAPRKYWKARFKDGIPFMEFSPDYQRPAIQTVNGDAVSSQMSSVLFSQLKRLSVEHETSVFAMMLCIVNVLFYRYTGKGDIILKTPVSGRTEKVMEDQIGFYINTLPLYTRIEEGLTFRDLLTKVKEELLEAFNFQLYPIDDLIETLKIRKESNRSPLSDIVLLYLNDTASQPISTMAGIEISEIDYGTRINKFDLRIVFGEMKNGLGVKVDYNTDIYKRDTIELFVSRLIRIAEAFVFSPEERIDCIDLSDENYKCDIATQDNLAQVFSGFSFN